VSWPWIIGGLVLWLWLKGRQQGTTNTVSGLYSAAVVKISEAIAIAEGYWVTGSLSARSNNPGSLKLGRQLIVFPDAESGWQALYRQVALILNGQSRYYSADMPISQVAVVWTGGDNPGGWAQTVAQQVGVTTSTPLSEVA